MGALVSKLTFRPPTHATYSDVDGKMLFIRKKTGDKKGELMQEELIYLNTALGYTIAALHFRQKNSQYTILYSHANMEDLGLTARFCSEMSDYLQQNVFVYDYTGYGLSTGKPSEKNTYADINAAYSHLTQELGVRPEHIIAMGRSVGTGPTVDLAARCQVGGLILLCPMTSCVRVMKKVQTTPNYDIFANIDKIHRVRCHVLVVHGRNDSTIPIEHAVQLSRKARCAATPLWVEEANHNDLEVDYKLVLLKRYREFLEHLDMTQPVCPEATIAALQMEKKTILRRAPVKVQRAVALYAKLDTGTIGINVFEEGSNLHIFMESGNILNPQLSPLEERVAICITHRLLSMLLEVAQPKGEGSEVIEKLNAYEYGVTIPKDESKQLGSWAYILHEQNEPGFELVSWIAGIVLFWLLSGQEAYVGTGGVDAACTGTLNFGPEWSNVSSDCKLVVRRLLMIDGKRRLSPKEAISHRVFAENTVDATTETAYVTREDFSKLLVSQKAETKTQLGCLYLGDNEDLPIPEIQVAKETVAVGMVVNAADFGGRVLTTTQVRNPKGMRTPTASRSNKSHLTNLTPGTAGEHQPPKRSFPIIEQTNVTL